MTSRKPFTLNVDVDTIAYLRLASYQTEGKRSMSDIANEILNEGIIARTEQNVARRLVDTPAEYHTGQTEP